MLFFIRFFCSIKYKFSLGKYLFPLFYFACIQFMRFYFFCSRYLLKTPTTPTDRMKSIVSASEGFVYLVRSFSLLDKYLSCLSDCPFFCIPNETIKF